MQQTIKNSQTPKFDTNKSQTRALYHELPKPQPKHKKIIEKIKVNTIEFTKFSVLSFVAWIIVSFIVASYFGG